jgi:hypothetical protein
MRLSKKYQNQKMIQSSLFSLCQILGFRVRLHECFDASLAMNLRTHTFKNQNEKDCALNQFCSIVFSNRNVHDAIHIDFHGPSCMNSIPFEQSIARGKRYKILDEFNCHDGLAVPMWYLTSSTSS